MVPIAVIPAPVDAGGGDELARRDRQGPRLGPGEHGAERVVVRAEICGTLLNADGNVIDGIVDRRIAVPTAGLRAIPEVIAAQAKSTAVLAAIRSGLIHEVVTDTQVARELLAPRRASARSLPAEG